MIFTKRCLKITVYSVNGEPPMRTGSALPVSLGHNALYADFEHSDMHQNFSSNKLGRRSVGSDLIGSYRYIREAVPDNTAGAFRMEIKIKEGSVTK